jgi:hypothetical protein
MRICWDDLCGVYLSKQGYFIKNSITMIYKDECIICSKPYLTEKRRPSKYCSHKCIYESQAFANRDWHKHWYQAIIFRRYFTNRVDYAKAEKEVLNGKSNKNNRSQAP